jgi:hypothetical protein
MQRLGPPAVVSHLCVYTDFVECTYAHFQKDSKCPVCGQVLGSEDFLEMVIASDATADDTASLTRALQPLFMKKSDRGHKQSNKGILPAEWYHHTIRALNEKARIARLAMKQLQVFAQSSAQFEVSPNGGPRALSQENIALKQQLHSEKLSHAQRMSDLRRRIESLNTAISMKVQDLADRDHQIAKFQQLYGGTSAAQDGNVPSSHSSFSRDNGGGGGRRGRGDGSSVGSRTNSHTGHLESATGGTHAPPMPSFVHTSSGPPAALFQISSSDSRELRNPRPGADMLFTPFSSATSPRRHLPPMVGASSGTGAASVSGSGNAVSGVSTRSAASVDCFRDVTATKNNHFNVTAGRSNGYVFHMLPRGHATGSDEPGPSSAPHRDSSYLLSLQGNKAGPPAHFSFSRSDPTAYGTGHNKFQSRF